MEPVCAVCSPPAPPRAEECTPTRPIPHCRPITPALTPARAAAPAAATTLYHHGASLSITRDMTAAEALRAIAAWAQAVHRLAAHDVPGGMDALVHRVDVGPNEQPPGADRQTCAAVVRDLRLALRRDLGVDDPAAISGKTLLLLGLMVPLEVCGIQPHPAQPGCTVLDLLVKTATDIELRMAYQLPNASSAPLGTQDAVDVLYALAPALAALFHAHGIDPAADVPQLLMRAGVRPRVPACIMQPAERAPCMGRNKDAHVGECVVYGRQGLQACGYHVPDLDGIALVDMPLGTWLRTRVVTVHDAAKIEDMLVPELRALAADLDRVQLRVQAVQAYVARLQRVHMLPMPLP